MERRTIIITVEGGVIQEVDIPDDTIVKVIDFDIEGTPDYELDVAPDGNPCIIREWRNM